MISELIHNIFVIYIRHMPFNRGKQRLINRLWQPLSFGRFHREVHLQQGNVRMCCDLTQYVQRQLYFWASYEFAECQFWLARARNAKIIFDIGANVGIYTLLAAVANPYGVVHAFEPTPVITDILRSNIQLNELKNVRVNQMGITDKRGTAFLYLTQGDSQDNEGMNFVVYTSNNQQTLSIEVTSIDDYCHQNSIDEIDLMKIDIEGGEIEALKGAYELLQQQRIKCILLEAVDWALNRNGQNVDDLLSLLRGLNYELFELHQGTPNVLPHGRRPQGHNIIALPMNNL